MVEQSSGKTDAPELEEDCYLERLLVHIEGTRFFDDLSEFSDAMLSELLALGLSRKHRLNLGPRDELTLPVKRVGRDDGDTVRVTRSEALFRDDTYLELADLDLMSLFPEKRRLGYRVPSSLNKPLRSEAAILAAMSVMEAIRERAERSGYSDHERQPIKNAEDRGLALTPHKFTAALLRHYRTDLDALSVEQETLWIKSVQARVEAVERSVNLLLRTLLETSPTNRLDPREPGDPNKGLRAALLKDVGGFRQEEIRSILCLPDRSVIGTIKGGSSSAASYIRAGREFFIEALGSEQAYVQYCNEKKQEAEAFSRLTGMEKGKYMVANFLSRLGLEKGDQTLTQLAQNFPRVLFNLFKGRFHHM